MIRINLAKSNNFMNAEEIGKSSDFFGGELSLKFEQDHILKVLVMLTFIFALVGYEKYTLFNLKKSLQSSQAQVNEIQQKIDGFGNVGSVIEELIKEKEKMNAKLKVIEKISRRKTLKINSLLKIQEHLPEDMWLKTLSFKKKKLLFNGYSRKTSSIQKMVQRLNELKFVNLAVSKGIKRVGSKIETQKFSIELVLKE